MRALITILLVMTAIGLVVVYGLKYQAEQTATEIGTLEKRIERKTEVLTTLRADWSYLNQPSSLEPIVRRHAETLGIAPISPSQYDGLSEVGMRPATEPNSQALEALLLALEAGIDPALDASIGDQ